LIITFFVYSSINPKIMQSHQSTPLDYLLISFLQIIYNIAIKFKLLSNLYPDRGRHKHELYVMIGRYRR